MVLGINGIEKAVELEQDPVEKDIIGDITIHDLYFYTRRHKVVIKFPSPDVLQ